jgi:Fe-Mn family superoxide dismutase
MEHPKGKKRFNVPGKSGRGPEGEEFSVTRRRPALPPAKPEGEVARASRSDRFAARDFTPLLGLTGFSEALLRNHFELYQGYVKNANQILGDLEQLAREDRLNTPAAAEPRRRFGWEYDSIRLHELYFENLTKTPRPLDAGSRLSARMQEDYGSFDAWKKDFLAAGSMRGIGWVVTYHDPLRNRLFNAWINEHDAGHLVACTPVIVLDVFEHAYMIDYGVKKAGYLEAFFQNLHWDTVTSRLP